MRAHKVFERIEQYCILEEEGEENITPTNIGVAADNALILIRNAHNKVAALKDYVNTKLSYALNALKSANDECKALRDEQNVITGGTSSQGRRRTNTGVNTNHANLQRVNTAIGK